MKSSGGERGISLVETLVAVAILAIALTTFITVLSAGARGTSELGTETVAQQLAQSQLERTKAAAYDISGSSYTLVPAPAGYSIALSVNSALYTNANIQKITVVVSRAAQTVLTVEDYKVNR